jgi:hypothetical protein
MPGGKKPGPSVKNPATYEALKRDNPKMSKASAAAIANAALAKGHKKGVHRKPGQRGKPLHGNTKRTPQK